MKEEINKKIRVVLPNNIFYTGRIISEDENFITILDIKNHEVRLNKNHIISMEILQ